MEGVVGGLPTLLVAVLVAVALWYWLGRASSYEPPSNRPAFNVLYPNSQEKPDVEVDIIAVHGLGSNVDWSWTWKDHTRKQHVHWLKDANMLPAVVPESRVLAYNYDSKWPRALAHVRTMLCGPELTEPLSLASLLLESAGCWEVLGYYTAWEGFLIQTLELREQLLGAEHPETARARFHLTKTLIYIGIDVETQEMLQNFRSHSLFGERIAFLGLLEKFEEEKLAQQSISKSR